MGMDMSRPRSGGPKRGESTRHLSGHELERVQERCERGCDSEWNCCNQRRRTGYWSKPFCHCYSESSRDVTNSCNSHTNAWQRLTVRNTPIHVSGHSVCTINGEAWVFGGCGKTDGQERCFNDLHRFNPETMEWVKVEPGPGSDTPPLPRRNCAMCPYKNSSLIIAGGAGDNPEDLMSDVYEFNIPTRQWRRIIFGEAASKLCLCGQSAIWIGGSKMLFFGGSTGLEYTSDLVEANVYSGTVRTIKCTGDLPSARYKHQVEIHGGGMWLIGGGDFRPQEEELYVYFLDFSDMQWHCIKTNGDIPKGRVAHSCSYDPVEGAVYVWGGFTSALTCVPSLDKYIFETKTWVRLDECRESKDKGGLSTKFLSPITRSFHGSAFLDGTLYAFFGSNGSQKLRDVWAWRVRSTPPPLLTLAARAVVKSTPRARLGDTLKNLPPSFYDIIALCTEYPLASRLQ